MSSFDLQTYSNTEVIAVDQVFFKKEEEKEEKESR